MMQRSGLDTETAKPDEATFQEFQELFKLPLTPSKREALNVLFPGRRQRGSRTAPARRGSGTARAHRGSRAARAA